MKLLYMVLFLLRTQYLWEIDCISLSNFPSFICIFLKKIANLRTQLVRLKSGIMAVYRHHPHHIITMNYKKMIDDIVRISYYNGNE